MQCTAHAEFDGVHEVWRWQVRAENRHRLHRPARLHTRLLSHRFLLLRLRHLLLHPSYQPLDLSHRTWLWWMIRDEIVRFMVVATVFVITVTIRLRVR